MDKQLQPNDRKKHSAPLNVSIEDDARHRLEYVLDLGRCCGGNTSRAFGIAHPATKATIKAAKLTANKILYRFHS